MRSSQKAFLLHLSLILSLFGLFMILPEYHQSMMTRILVLTIFAMGYNLLFAYIGLLSLGHALFFAAGMYGMGLSLVVLKIDPVLSILFGIFCASLLGAIIGYLTRHLSSIALMIVTLMFAQAGWYLILYLSKWTKGDEGFVIPSDMRNIDLYYFGSLNLIDSHARFLVAWLCLSLMIFLTSHLVQSRFGKVMIAIRENEPRTIMLGYDVKKYKIGTMVISSALSGLSGAIYALMFGYVGASFASVQYSILPLLWVLLGGAGTIIGPLVGTGFMTYLIDISSEYTHAHMLVAGIVLIILALFLRQGLIGVVRRKWVPWLP